MIECAAVAKAKETGRGIEEMLTHTSASERSSSAVISVNAVLNAASWS